MSNFATYRRFIDPEMAEELTGILDEHGIPYRVDVAKAPVDLTFSPDPTHRRILVSIPPDLFVKADEAQESIAPEAADGGFGDHHLHEFADDELTEVLHNAREWHPADVVVARRLLESRGVEIEEKKVEEKQAQHLEKQRQPMRAPFVLIAAGFIFSLLGGLIGFGIGWSLVSMKERDATGKIYHRYDGRSRDLGRCMILIGGIAMIIWWFLGGRR